MSFDDILAKKSESEKQGLIKQALKKQEYNRNYQAKLREAAKLATLERKIDDNLDHVLRYIKKHYAIEYKAIKPIKPVVEKLEDSAFTNWLVLSQPRYRSIQYAYDVASLDMSLDEFTKLFKQYFKINGNEWIKF